VKRLGILTLVACTALVVSATAAASVASASKFVAGAGSELVQGKEKGIMQLQLSTKWVDTECWMSLGESIKSGGEITTLEAQITGGNCNIYGGVKVDGHGCKLIFHPGVESSGVTSGTFDIGPSNCGPITIGSPEQWCNMSIYPKAGLSAEYRNVGKGAESEVEFTADAYGLKAVGGELGGCRGTDESVGIEDSWNLAAFGGYPSKEKGLSVVHPPPNLYIDGEKSTEEAKQPKFRTVEYPAAITGEQVGGNDINIIEFTTVGGSIECEQADFNGFASGASSSLLLAPAFGECFAFGYFANIHPNGCEYTLSVANTNSPYSGSLGLSCKSGKSLEVEVLTGTKVVVCTVSYPAQTIGPVSYLNEGEEPEEYVLASMEDEGIEYSVSGDKYCGSESVHKDGTLLGTIKLEGHG
jgi:hypothetical protein